MKPSISEPVSGTNSLVKETKLKVLFFPENSTTESIGQEETLFNFKLSLYFFLLNFELFILPAQTNHCP